MQDDLYSQICCYDNLCLAFKKARKRKTLKPYVVKFEKNLKNNLLQLRTELLFGIYQPKPLEVFILRDPKTRKISKSDFRDRVVHHALCNIIEPIFDKTFIYDSYANRIGKGVLKAVERFDCFKRKVSKNNTKTGFVLKADIKHYFETVDNNILIDVIKKKVNDIRVIWLIRIILENHTTKIGGKSMPLGNLTSQFFANIYLNELDQFVKHILRAKHYIRYVDDFVILHISKKKLDEYKLKIATFLKEKLALDLHLEKSKILPITKGTDFLGFRIFPYHRLVRKKNIRKFSKKLYKICLEYDNKSINYDKVYDFLEGWMAYSRNADTYRLRRGILNSVEAKFLGEISSKEINRCLRGDTKFFVNHGY